MSFKKLVLTLFIGLLTGCSGGAFPTLLPLPDANAAPEMTEIPLDPNSAWKWDWKMKAPHVYTLTATERNLDQIQSIEWTLLDAYTIPGASSTLSDFEIKFSFTGPHSGYVIGAIIIDEYLEGDKPVFQALKIAINDSGDWQNIGVTINGKAIADGKAGIEPDQVLLTKMPSTGKNMSLKIEKSDRECSLTRYETEGGFTIVYFFCKR